MTDKRNFPVPRRRKYDRLLMLLSVMYFTGVVLGTVLYCTLDSDRIDILDGMIENFVSGRILNSFGETVVNSFAGAFFMLAVCFFLGFCIIAGPAEILIPLFRGLGTGTAAAVMYGRYGLSGAGASAFLIVPEAVMSAFVLIMAARESIRFSAALYRASVGKNSGGECPDVKLYFTKFVILCAGLALSSVIDSIVTFASAGLWTGLLGV